MEKIKVILVDDHRIVRDGIRSLITGENDIDVIAEASGYDELEPLLSNTAPDIIIMDISLPGKSGIEVTRIVKEKYPEINIIILSMYIHNEFIFNSIKEGASGYLPKNITKKELLDAIRTVHSGANYFSRHVSDIILKSYVNTAQGAGSTPEEMLQKLTRREIEILKLFAAGKTNKDIANELFISVRTVESHKNHIMQKLKLKTTVDLVKFAIKQKIVDI